MATLRWSRNLASDVNGIKNTYSSWDSCMTKAYCKWPVIPPPQPIYQQPYQQYQSQAPPMYVGGGYRGAPVAATATFDGPSRSAVQMAPAGKYNPDALPAMPSMDNAASRHIEEDDMEMEKLDHFQAQQQSLLPQQENRGYYNDNRQQLDQQAGDVGAMQHPAPYHDYNAHRQYAGSVASSAQPSIYPPTYHSNQIQNGYGQTGQQPQRSYAPSVPPIYRTAPPSIMSPVSPPPQNGGIGRKPVQGTWRDV
ncbi:hypothetical protein LTR62_001790 [Meristemomyces frigidus]|uniref:Uncharacterized protein n=1 Tax=Meristemomyces frigidus TaxID=1508187 RepID=A0AAN7TH62_9PEZI|nr:hypothetical protein LTR62_001790 [Meristemomyces frigidus]